MANDLISAAQKGDIDIVRILLDNGANINFINNHGRTVLMLASIEGYLNIVNLLLDMGALINLQNNYGITALMFASIYGNTDIVKLLLDNGANIDIVNNEGNTALRWASRRGYTDIVEILNRHRAYSNIQSTFRGRRTRRKIRTLKAKQRLALSRHPLADDLTEQISKILNRMPYNPEVSRRMLEEEQDDPYTEWLQDRSQLGSGQRSNRRKRSKRSRSKRSRRKYML